MKCCIALIYCQYGRSKCTKNNLAEKTTESGQTSPTPLNPDSVAWIPWRGLVTLLPDGSSHRCRYVPSKRADVARGLIQRFFAGL